MDMSSGFFLPFILLFRTMSIQAKVLEATYKKWTSYRAECLHKMEVDPPRSLLHSGLFCNRTFNEFACWPDGDAGFLINVSCPWYLPWYSTVHDGVVYQRCGVDGNWVLDADGLPWMDAQQCSDNQTELEYVKTQRFMESFRIMYTVGYSLSLAALILALILFLAFRRLHCTRTYIHMNLFASFALRALSVLTKDVLHEKRWNMDPETTDWGSLLSHQAAVGCRAAQAFMQYGIGANYHWALVEGMFLHSLLLVPSFSGEAYLRHYLALGWGTPLLFIVPWIFIKLYKENTECWGHNVNLAYWWIIRCPIHLTLLINFVIFVRILKILVSKLRANLVRCTDYKFRLAKSTMTLIPLLGIHEIVFTFITDEQAHGAVRYTKLYLILFLNSFQGLLVAILYCFLTKEVRAEVRRQWNWSRHTFDLGARISHPGLFLARHPSKSRIPSHSHPAVQRSSSSNCSVVNMVSTRTSLPLFLDGSSTCSINHPLPAQDEECIGLDNRMGREEWNEF
uniref:glucagon receptor-like n=1 Tax=Myxine glutinosa TaxID=7769 RepID=UPI00358FE620